MKSFTPENILFIGSLMLLIGLLAGKMSSRVGVPSLLLFLLIGMGMGVDGIGYHFDSPETAQFIGMMALSVILFSGGMDTKFSDIRPVLKQGIVLATFGVLATAGITGLFIWGVGHLFGFELGLPESLLLAAVMSSTDSASVFALLRSKGLKLKENLRPTLELESGSNDPMAYILSIVLIEYIGGSVDTESAVITFIQQIMLGSALGVVLGYAGVWFVNRISFSNTSLYSVMVVACVFFIFSSTDAVGGNGYLAVYISGLIFGNSKVAQRRNTARFFDGFAWLWQIVMFLSLGLLVNPSDLGAVSGFGLLVGAFMILFGRPISVVLSLIGFRTYSKKGLAYASWVGLRGAVPIIFATYPLVENIPDAKLIFDTVFFISIMSLIIQGMTVTSMAKWLGVGSDDDIKPSDFGVELPDEIKSAMTEIDVTETLLSEGNTMMSLNLPSKTLVIMIKRDAEYFIPKGGTELKVGDKLLVISDDVEELHQACEKLGVSHYSIERNV